MSIRDELPLRDGEGMFWVIVQVVSGPAGTQLLQMLYSEGSSAYPVHPPFWWRLVKVPEVVEPPPTVIVTGVVAAPPHLSHSWTTVLYTPGLRVSSVFSLAPCTV